MADDLCICGCGQPKRSEATWLSVEARMFASDACDRRWTHGLATCPSCQKDFPKFLGGRVTPNEMLCPACYESHPAICGKPTAKVRAWEHQDEFQKVRRA